MFSAGHFTQKLKYLSLCMLEKKMLLAFKNE